MRLLINWRKPYIINNMDTLCNGCKYAVTLHPCTVERCYDSSFAVGMYELEEITQTRKGIIALYEAGSKLLNKCELSSGVLDMKYNNSYLACALSNSSISILRQDKLTNQLICVSNNNSDCFDAEDGLYLSLDYCSYDESLFSRNNIIVSTQSGSVVVFAMDSSLDEIKLTCDARYTNLHKLQGVSQPVWTVTYDPYSGDGGNLNRVFLTGGDDGSVKLWDSRTLDAQADSPSPVSVLRYHQAGVTSAQYHPTDDTCFATGSYDEQLCVWDKRRLGSPVSSMDAGSLAHTQSVVHVCYMRMSVCRWRSVAHQVVHAQSCPGERCSCCRRGAERGVSRPGVHAGRVQDRIV